VIAKNILNGEGDSMIKQIVKENVKAVISEKKEIISASFAAVIQTLKVDPQMINLIYNTGTANNGEQFKGDNNNAIKYLESNKIFYQICPKRITKVLSKH
jgi:phosphoribosylaminoimidazole (AIR) synthetase